METPSTLLAGFGGAGFAVLLLHERRDPGLDVAFPCQTPSSSLCAPPLLSPSSGALLAASWQALYLEKAGDCGGKSRTLSPEWVFLLAHEQRSERMRGDLSYRCFFLARGLGRAFTCPQQHGQGVPSSAERARGGKQHCLAPWKLPPPRDCHSAFMYTKQLLKKRKGRLHFKQQKLKP